jgi:Protein of unknown function (DUF3843)
MKLFKKDQVFMVDWLKLKPYQNPNLKYDNFYVNLCNTVYEILKGEEGFFDDQEMEREQLKQLACVIVSYYEDFISEIGIWKAFTQHNKTFIDEYIPFYETNDYDPDYINWQDIAYLIWHYATKWYDERVFPADYTVFVDLGKEIFETLDEYIDDSPTTVFYDKLFTIKGESNYFDFKSTLNWFSTEAYTMGIEFGNSIKQQVEDLDYEHKANPHFYAMMYQVKEEFLCRKKSSFGALNAPEWLADVFRCDEDKKKEIRNLSKRHYKHFVYEGVASKDFYKFRHYVTEREYLIYKGSFQKGTDKIKEGDVVEMYLIEWDKKWWLSGMMISYAQKSSDKKLKEVKNQPIENQWILDDKTLAENKDQAVDMEKAFLQLYGKRIKLCKSVEELQSVFDAVSEQNAKNKGFYDNFMKAKEKRGSFASNMTNSLKEEFGNNTDLAVFFLKEQGTQMLVGAKETIEALKAKTLSEEDSIELFRSLSNGYEPQVAQYFLDEYPTKNVKMPGLSKINVLKNMPYFWRFHSPSDFHEAYPLYTTVNNEQIDEMRKNG